MVQRSRRGSPYPFTWEIPAAVVVAVVLVLVLTAQVGRSVANLLAGQGWVFIDRVHLFTSLPGVLSGDAAAGLPHVARPAAPGVLWTCIVVVELVVVAACVVAAWWGVTRFGPGRVRGAASRAQVEQLLGISRLRRHAGVVRPDLYRRGRGIRGWGGSR